MVIHKGFQLLVDSRRFEQFIQGVRSGSVLYW